MASGFFLGGMAEGFTNQQQIQQRQQLLNLENTRLQQAQQNQDRNFYMDLTNKWMDNVQQTIEAVTEAKQADFPSTPPDRIRRMVINDLMTKGGISIQLDHVKQLYQKLGIDPSQADAQITAMFSMPSKAQTMAVEARAKEGPQHQALVQSEIEKNRAAASLDAQVTGTQTNPDLDTQTQLGGKQFKSTGNSDADSIIKGIDSGDTPPDLKGVYGKNKTKIIAGLENNGINLAQRQLQWDQAKKQVQSLNGPQMIRYAGLNTSVINTIDEVNTLAQQMNMGGIPLLNQAQLTKLVQTEGNSPKGQLAAKYLTTVNTLKEEFANLAQGGYAPTEAAWSLANQQINANYGVKELAASLGEVQKLLKIRVNAIPGFSQVGPTGANPYTGKKGTKGSGEWTVERVD